MHACRSTLEDPTLVVTDLVRENFRDNQEKLKLLASRIPMERSGEVDEVSASVLWLCSTEASFITGAQLSVDGGTVI